MRVAVQLTDQEFARLQELAIAERRPVRDQAGWMLAKALDSEPLPTSKVALQESAAEAGR